MTRPEKKAAGANGGGDETQTNEFYTTQTRNAIAETITECVAGGLSVIPIDHTSKRPAMWVLPTGDNGKPTWDPFKQEIADEQTLDEWRNSGILAYAVVGGEVSGGLLIIDFDVPSFYDAWLAKVGELADTLPVQQTGGGGYQVFLRCENPGGNQKLAWAKDNDEVTGRTIAIETRAEGGYAVGPGSIHPNGRKYESISGTLADIPTVSQEAADALLQAARELDEAPHTLQQLARIAREACEEHRRKREEDKPEGGVIQAYNGAHAIEELLERHGYLACASGRFLRPGGASESVSVFNGRSCHWSTNDALNDGKFRDGMGVHDAFSIFCELEHGGDLSAAVKAAADELGMRSDPGGTGGGKGSASTLLADLATDCELFHHGDKAYVSFLVTNENGESHRETHAIGGLAFRRWLTAAFYRIYGKLPASQAMDDVINLLHAKAIYDGPEHPVAIRLAEHDGAILLDLVNEKWEGVRITPEGWEIVDRPEIRFIRRKGMEPLPRPTSGGSISDLRPLLNAADDSTWMLVVGWLIGAYRPRGPYAILVQNGEQGSAKSTTSRMLRRLVDPNAADLRAAPKGERDLMIAASNSWVAGFDNMSYLSPELSDSLCRLATGAGFATRMLYTDNEEEIFSAARPIVINGIEEMVTRPDLLDRTILTTLPILLNNQRRAESALWTEYERVRPGVLGAILDAVSTALKNLPSVHLEERPRMADFAEWVVAAEPALPWEQGSFLPALLRNRAEAGDLAIESASIGLPVMELMETRSTWDGTAKSLLALLEARMADKAKWRQDWPKNPKAMSNALRRLAPALRQVGIEVTFGKRTRCGTPIMLMRIPVAPSSSTPPSYLGPTDPGVNNLNVPEDEVGHGDDDDGSDDVTEIPSDRTDQPVTLSVWARNAVHLLNQVIDTSRRGRLTDQFTAYSFKVQQERNLSEEEAQRVAFFALQKHLEKAGLLGRRAN